MIENEQFAIAEVLPCHTRGALFIGQNKAAADHANAFCKLAPLPPAIQQRCHTACHHNRHIGNDPVRRVARGDAYPLPFLKLVTFDQATCEGSGSGICFGKA